MNPTTAIEATIRRLYKEELALLEKAISWRDDPEVWEAIFRRYFDRDPIDPDLETDHQMRRRLGSKDPAWNELFQAGALKVHDAVLANLRQSKQQAAE